MTGKGCVAIGTPNQWEGVYNPWDSYPAQLGREVWAKTTELGAKRLAKELRKFQRWPEFREHGDGAPVGEEATLVAPETGRALGVEWVYVVEPEAGALHVLVADEGPSGADGFDLVGSYDIAGPEPDWSAIQHAVDAATPVPSQ